MAQSEEKDPESFVFLADSMNEDFSILPLLENMPISLKESLDKCQFVNKDEKLLSESFKELDFKSAFQSEYALDDEIESKVMALLAENQNLKETLQQNNLAMRKQVETLNNWQKEVFAVHESHKAKFEDTKELIKILKADNIELNKRLTSADIQPFPHLEEQVKAENELLKDQLSRATQELQKSIINQSMLMTKINELQKRITNQEPDQNPTTNNPLGDENILTKQQTEIQIGYLKEKIENQSKELNIVNQELLNEKESADILKIQLEVYQSDFNAERDAREKIVGEKELLAEDLRDLKMRNEKLLKEIEQLKRGH